MWINQKTYFRLPMSGMVSVDENPTTATLTRMGELEPPLVLTHQSLFHASIEAEEPLLRMHGKFKMWVVLRGLHARGIQ